jgi:protease I
MGSVRGMKVAILVTDGFEQDELLKPRKALDEAGANTKVVSPKDETMRGWKYTDWGSEVKGDVRLNEVKPDHFDALLLPGGVMNPDKLRTDPKVVEFVKSFFASGKPVAAICHGPWTIIEAGAARGRKIASWPSVKTDLRNAGAVWVDTEAVIDGNLVSARKPDDIPAFNRAMIEVFGEAQDKNKKKTAEEAASERPVKPISNDPDPGRHVQHLKLLLNDVAVRARDDIRKVSDPKAQALFETTAEALKGLAKAFDDYETNREEVWKTAGSL